MDSEESGAAIRVSEETWHPEMPRTPSSSVSHRSGSYEHSRARGLAKRAVDCSVTPEGRDIHRSGVGERRNALGIENLNNKSRIEAEIESNGVTKDAG